MLHSSFVDDVSGIAAIVNPDRVVRSAVGILLLRDDRAVSAGVVATVVGLNEGEIVAIEDVRAARHSVSGLAIKVVDIKVCSVIPVLVVPSKSAIPPSQKGGERVAAVALLFIASLSLVLERWSLWSREGMDCNMVAPDWIQGIGLVPISETGSRVGVGVDVGLRSGSGIVDLVANWS